MSSGNPLDTVSNISDDISVNRFIEAIIKTVKRIYKETNKGKVMTTSVDLLGSSEAHLYPALHRCFEAYRSANQVGPAISLLINECIEQINKNKLAFIQKNGANEPELPHAAEGVLHLHMNKTGNVLSSAKLLPAYTLTGILNLVQDYETAKLELCRIILGGCIKDMVSYLKCTPHVCKLEVCQCQSRYTCGALIEKTTLLLSVRLDPQLLTVHLLDLNGAYDSKKNLHWLHALSTVYPSHGQDTIEKHLYAQIVRDFKQIVHTEKPLHKHNQIMLAYLQIIDKVSSTTPTLFNARLFNPLAVYQLEPLQNYNTQSDQRLTYDQYMTLMNILEKVAKHNCTAMQRQGDNYYNNVRNNGRFDLDDIGDKQVNTLITQINTVLLTVFTVTKDDYEAARVIDIMGQELGSTKEKCDAIKSCILRDWTVVALDSQRNKLIKSYTQQIKLCTKKPKLKDCANKLMSIVKNLKDPSYNVQYSSLSDTKSTGADSRVSTSVSVASSKSCTIS